MNFLNFDRLQELDPHEFQSQIPYPWVNPDNLLTSWGYQQLLNSLPDISLFQKMFGKERKYGQKSHDRFTLEFHPDLNLTQPWQAFIQELQGKEYTQFLYDMFGVKSLSLSFHWHYAINGCSISPHCDANRKLGSHIFYFNTSEDWDPTWGGETLILNDHNRLNRASAPEFSDFDEIISSVALGNRSLLFTTRNDSWHGVQEIQCPEDRVRKVFIVVINKLSLSTRLTSLFKNSPDDY